MEKNVVVTGFDWYRGKDYTIYHPNPSGLIASILNDKLISGYRVYGRIFRVNYSAIKELWKILEELKPEIVIGLGLSPRIDKPYLELAAVNYGYSDINEYKGFLWKGKPLVVNIQVDFEKLIEYLKEKGFDIRPSNTLGLYLCNAVAYTIYLYALENRAKAVFLHIPPVGDLRIRLRLPLRISYGLYELVELVKSIIEYFASNS
ncbi:MAG: pyrrolidone-carboxylate peptidase [Thermoprotei archaeon]